MAEKKKKASTAKKAPVRRKKETPEAVKPASLPAPEVRVERPKAPRITGPKFFGTGRRKEAVVKVWITPGSGKITVNRKPMTEYFCGRKLLEYYASRPLSVIPPGQQYDVFAQAAGGGIPGQAAAVGLGIARALISMNPELKPVLKKEGLLTRDPRMKERKKYGLKRARRAFQYTKR